MTESVEKLNLTIYLNSSILREDNIKGAISSHVKQKYNLTSTESAFIKEVINVSPKQMAVDNTTAELKVQCSCQVKLLKIDETSVIPIKLSIVRPEAARGEMVDCPNVQLLIIHKGIDKIYKVGDVVTARPSCVRYEPEKVACRGDLVE